MPGLLYLLAMVVLSLCLRLLVLPAGLSDPTSMAGHPNKLIHNLDMLKSLPLVFSPLLGKSARWFFWRLISFSGFLYLSFILVKNKIPLVLRRYLIAIFPPCLLAAVFVGNLEETRVFYPLLPALILAGVIFLEKRSMARTAVLVLMTLFLSGLFIGSGPLLKKDGEFAVKSAAFQVREFKLWEKTARRFSPRHMKIRGDQAIIDLSSFRRKFYFLDASLLVTSRPDTPVPVSCRFSLENGYSHAEFFWREPDGYVTISRNINLEMGKPSLQTEVLQKIIIRFDRNLEGAPPPVISWKGFTSPKRNL